MQNFASQHTVRTSPPRAPSVLEREMAGIEGLLFSRFISATLIGLALNTCIPGSLRADPAYVQCGKASYYNGYSDSGATLASTAGGFAGSATYLTTASGAIATDGGRYCAGGASADSLPWVKILPGVTASQNGQNQTAGGGGALAHAGGVYQLYLSRGSDASVSSDVLMYIAAANATLSASSTTAFKSGTANAVNNWAPVCIVTCASGHASDVTVTFTYHSGTVDSTHRVVSAAFKFDYLGQPISFSTQPAATASVTAGGSVNVGPVATTGPLAAC
jgi:hypothetical protein